jgi:hypothetical protein
MEDPRVDGRITFKKLDWGNMDWIKLPQDRNTWGTLVNMVMNLQVLQNAGHFLTT